MSDATFLNISGAKLEQDIYKLNALSQNAQSRSQMTFYETIKLDSLVKSRTRRQSKKIQIQGAQILRNEAYLQYAAMTKDAAQHRSWTFYEAVKLDI